MNIVENMTEESAVKLTVTITPDEIRSWLAEWVAIGEKARGLENPQTADWSDERVQKTAKKALFGQAEAHILDAKSPSPIDTPFFATNQSVSLDEPFVFAIDYTVIPERELSSYEPAKIRLPKLQTTDEEVNEALKEILKSVPCSQDKPEGSVVENGDTVEISMEATSAEGRYDALSSSLRQYRLGDDFMPPAFDEALLGLKVGDEAVCSLKIERKETPNEDDESEKTYIDVDVRLKLLRLLREDVNSISDDFVQRQFPGIHTTEQLRHAIRLEIEDSKKDMLEEAKIRHTVSELTSRLQGGIPDAVYEAFYRMAVKNIVKDLEDQGSDLESFLAQQGVDKHQFRTSAMMDIRGQIRQAAALDAYACHFGIEADESDLNEYLNYVLSTEGEDTVKLLEETPYRAGLIDSTRRWKAQNHAVKHAVIGYF